MWHCCLINFIGSNLSIMRLIYFTIFTAATLYTNGQDTPPNSSKELWRPPGQNLNLCHHDAHLAVYFDHKINHNITWFFSPLSQAWEYTKKTYDSFGPDPHLYFILDSEKNKDCSIATFRMKRNGSRNYIECGALALSSSEWIRNSLNLDKLLSYLGHIVWRGAKKMFNNADFEVSIGSIKDIIVYDIYLHLKRANSSSYENDIDFKDDSLKEWKNMKQNESIRTIFWFRDWYLPIYERFGGASVLRKFYNHVYNNWTRRHQGDYEYMKKGEFVHFWSGAAGVDLVLIAKPAIKATNSTHEELGNARNVTNFNYLEISYGTERLQEQYPPAIWEYDRTDGTSVNCALIYYDDYVAFYSTNFKLHPLFPLFPLKLISTAWKYVNEKYFQWSSIQRLYISLENGTTGSSECSSDSTTSPNSARNHINLHFIDCVEDNPNVVPSSLSEKLISEIALKTLKLASNTNEKNWLAYNISRWSMTSIVEYDIYLTLGQRKEALQRKLKSLNESEHFHRNETFWFRDWYLKIYELNSEANQPSPSPVLQNFFSLLLQNRRITAGSRQQMTAGEFLHFWSGAAGKNLKNLTESMNWIDKDKLDNEWLEARVKFPNFNYTVPEPKESFPTNFFLQDPTPSNSNVLPPELTNVYKNDTNSIGIYFDTTIHKEAQVQTAVAWQSDLFSKLWRYLKTSYTDVLEKVDPNLYVTFREKRTKNCDLTPSRGMSSLEGDQKLSNVIDCGYVKGNSKAWEGNSRENVEPILNSLDKIVEIEIKFEETEETKKHSMSTAVKWMLKIVIFDMYLKEGRIKDAREWLKEDHESKITGIGKKDWFLHWCLPIYYHHGGVFVLNRILSISSKYLNVKTNISRADDRNVLMTKNGEIRDVNMGEFVHLWSGAANSSLKKLAEGVFGWNSETQDEFMEAQNIWTNITYECEDCVDPLAPPIDQSLAIIIGAGSGAILFVLSIAFGITFAINRRRINEMENTIRELTPKEIEEFHRGNNIYESDTANAPIHLLPFNNNYEIPKEKLDVVKQKPLGAGEYGEVFLGFIEREIDGNIESVQVAVKTVKPNVGVEYFKAMLTEIKIMAHIGVHENIASLLATVTTNIKTCEVFVALEFCANGDLLQFLRKNSANFKNLWNQYGNQLHKDATTAGALTTDEDNKKSSVEPGSYMKCEQAGYSQQNSPHLSTLDLLDWSYQISNGMAFLSSKNVIHGDLAARNVLLTSNNVAKISDFGLSRQIIKYSNYTKKSSVPLPWRWMAIESLNEMVFSVYTDVWAFGVTLWEIFTMGKVPYPVGNWNHDFMKSLEQGERLPQPEFGNSEIYNLLMFCWRKNPKERLGFPQIRAKLAHIKANLDDIARLHGGVTLSYYEFA